VPETLRAFLAVELPEGVRTSIEKLQRRLSTARFPVRWVAPANIHLTLKFLGDIPRTRIQSVAEAMELTCREFVPFPLKGKGVGAFPGFKKPRVLWVGLTMGVPEVRALQVRIEQLLEARGFPREDRPFRAHLTVGRMKGGVQGGDLARSLVACSDFETDAFQVGAVALFESDLQRTGPVYTRLREVPLGGGLQ